MNMEFEMPKSQSSIIKVLGVGGGGNNAVNHMYKQGIHGVDFVVCNTDKQALDKSPIPYKVQLGTSLSEGMGAGSLPEVGRNSAIEDIDKIHEILDNNTRMVFITAGMGGGTGTGAAPVIAQAAKERGILTVGIVTMPFNFEGKKRRMQAEQGIEEMRKHVDTILIINNERVKEMFGNMALADAFSKADNVLATAAKGIAEIITNTGIINVDLRDVQTVMKDSGVAIMGSATAEGENRAVRAVELALASPLLNDNNIQGARYILLNITYGNKEILMDEITEITDFIQEEAGNTADVIWGHGLDESLGNQISVTLIATGFQPNKLAGYTQGESKKENVKMPLDINPTPAPVNEVKAAPVAAPEVTSPFLKNEPKAPVVAETPIEKTPEPVQNPIAFDEPFVKTPVATVEPTPAPAAEVQPTEIRKEEEMWIKKVPTASASKPNAGSEISLEEQQKRANERLQKLRDISKMLRSPSGILDLENVPAYKRRDVTLNEDVSSSASEVSRYTLSDDLSDDGEKKTGLRPNNPFLHDNVD